MTGDAKDPIFLIQIEPVSGPIRQEMNTDKFIGATRETLDGVAGVIEESCQAFLDRITKLNAKPSEIGIEFGVDASGEAGIPLLTKGSLGANFKVTLKWTC